MAVPSRAAKAAPSGRSSRALYLGSSACSFLSHSAFSYGMIVLGQQASGSSGMSGLVFLSMFAPVIAFTVPIGALADTRSRRGLLAFALVGAAAVMATTGCAIAAGWVTGGKAGALLPMAFAYGISNAFVMPTRLALVGNLATGALAERMMVCGSVLQFLAVGAGPPIAGWLVARLGWPAVFAACAGLAAMSAIGIVALSEPHPQMRADRERARGSVRAGCAHLVAERRLLALCALGSALCVCLFGPFQVLVPEFARAVLDLDEAAKGAFMAPFGLGVLVGGAAAVAVIGLPWRGWLIAGNAAAAGLVFAVLPAARNPALGAALLALLGCFGGAAGALLTASLQAYSPDVYRGRIMAIYSWLLTGMSALGGAAFAGLAQLTDVSVALVAAGATVTLVVLSSAAAWPSLKKRA